MRALLCAAGALVAATLMAGSAQAQNYPWCAVYGNGFGGTNCGFSTFRQCLATIQGLGGSCQPNTQYHPEGRGRR
jgi:hypothetical protein